MNPDPLDTLAEWLDAARRAGEPLPNAMALATVNPDGEPAVRMVMLRGLDGGLLFFTDRESAKGADLVAHPAAAAVLHWMLPVQRQVRVAGPVVPATSADADGYWQSRSPEHRVVLAASHQDQVIGSRAELEAAVAAMPAGPPRPDRWVGYRLIPDSVEFWEEAPDLLHPRLRYRRSGDAWRAELLAP